MNQPSDIASPPVRVGPVRGDRTGIGTRCGRFESVGVHRHAHRKCVSDMSFAIPILAFNPGRAQGPVTD